MLSTPSLENLKFKNPRFLNFKFNGTSGGLQTELYAHRQGLGKEHTQDNNNKER